MEEGPARSKKGPALVNMQTCLFQSHLDRRMIMQFESTLAYARQLDEADELGHFRSQFIIPSIDGKEQIYFLGNSLGLQPVGAAEAINEILAQWARYGVEGFFEGDAPWLQYHGRLVKTLATIVGALPLEVVAMNSLTVNLHLMLVSFYRPEGKRRKIICEAGAFPSDQYALETHVRSLGLVPEEVIIEVGPRTGEFHLRTGDILKVIEENGEETALVLFGGINYYTGQFFDLPAITEAGHQVGARVGFDLAHAAGNVRLHLHDWGVDFAVWCSYKYLNSGPGGIGGAFIHERHHRDRDLFRFAGWWGYDATQRFKMEKGFLADQGALGWQLSTPSLLLYATHRAALDIFESAGWERIQRKRLSLNKYLWYVLGELEQGSKTKCFEIITPRDELWRGSQVSLLMLQDGKKVFEELKGEDIMVDWREPDVIRLAPVPLYTRFEDIWLLGESWRQILLK